MSVETTKLMSCFPLFYSQICMFFHFNTVPGINLLYILALLSIIIKQRFIEYSISFIQPQIKLKYPTSPAPLQKHTVIIRLLNIEQLKRRIVPSGLSPAQSLLDANCLLHEVKICKLYRLMLQINKSLSTNFVLISLTHRVRERWSFILTKVSRS